jgi:hypothetical protein
VQCLPSQGRIRLDQEFGQVDTRAELFEILLWDAVGHQAPSQQEHVRQAGQRNRHADGGQLEHADRPHAIVTHHAADDNVGRRADQRDGAGQDRGKRQGHQESGRTALCPTGHPNHHGQKEGRGGGVAHERPHHHRRPHHHHEKRALARLGAPQEPTPDGVGHAGAAPSLRHDQDAQDHKEDVAAKAGKCLFGREQAGDDQEEQHTEPDHAGGDPLQGKEDHRHDDRRQHELDLYIH